MENDKSILGFSNTEARKYFLRPQCYINFDLPTYFDFKPLLEKISKKINRKHLSDYYAIDSINKKPKKTLPGDFENVNYRLLNNKDGKFAWRPFQLIHPVLYVSLVQKITEKSNWQLILNRFKEFQTNPRIRCESIPIETTKKSSDKAVAINQWWQKIEQRSVEIALSFEYVLHTDVTDCYGSIYTHSIPWALHGKSVAKSRKKDNELIGNIIDSKLRDMSYGQTNGIPQGSTLMDFIAEMVLGFADLELSLKIAQSNVKDYQIIRYRDDYRIFSNNPQDAELITKLLTEILIDLGMRLNAQKTIVSNNVIRDSIKPDKLFWISSKNSSRKLQERLLIIHNLAQKFPNSGSLQKALNAFFGKIDGLTKAKQSVEVLISILVDITYKNPRTYPVSAAILSKLLSLISTPVKQEKILKAIITRFNKIPNTAHLKIWLQRITLKIDREKEYDENLCRKVNDNRIELWNSDWLNNEMKLLITSELIINENIIKKINRVVNQKEVDLFESKTDYEPY